MHLSHTVGERCRAGLKNIGGFYLIQLIVHHRRNIAPTGTHAHVLRAKALAAPRADNDIRPAARRLACKSENPRTRSGSSASILSILALIKAETLGFSLRACGGRTVKPEIPTIRFCSPSRYKVSQVSSVRQTIRCGWRAGMANDGLCEVNRKGQYIPQSRLRHHGPGFFRNAAISDDNSF